MKKLGLLCVMIALVAVNSQAAEKKKKAAAKAKETATAVESTAHDTQEAAAPAATKSKPLVDRVSNSVSGQGYGTAGCGLGSIVLGDKPGMLQIFAATTNGTSASQTFGITTGTSNCDTTMGSPNVAAVFVEANQQTLRKDVARGEGEALSHLSTVLQCSDASELGQTLQSRYSAIFATDNASSEAISAAISQAIQTNPSLNCGLVSKN